MRYFIAVAVWVSACALPSTKAQDHNSTRSNKTASIVAPPDPVLPMSQESALKPSCVDVQIVAGEEDPEGRAAGDPIHGVDVKLGSKPEALAQSATTDDTGTAHFCDLQFSKRGAFVLTAEAEGTNIAVSDPVLVVRAPRLIEWVKTPAAGHLGVALRSEDGSCPQVRVRSGRVGVGGINGSSDPLAYSAGDPIHGVDVKLGTKRGGEVVASATTDSNGVATFCDLVPRKKGAESYEPWTIDDADEGVVSNPLYESSGNQGSNPMFEGRSAVSPPVHVGEYSMIVAFAREPQVKMNAGTLDEQACPIVSVVAAAGFEALDPLREKAGAGVAGVDVTIVSVPGGATVTVRTGADGTAPVCSPAFPNETRAYNLRATAVNARPALSAPFTYTVGGQPI